VSHIVPNKALSLSLRFSLSESRSLSLRLSVSPTAVSLFGTLVDFTLWRYLDTWIDCSSICDFVYTVT
jgi:hypothetical protein